MHIQKGYLLSGNMKIKILTDKPGVVESVHTYPYTVHRSAFHL